jgi:membrane protein DedA with SNARE-associated domain
MTIVCLILLAALIVCILAAIGKAPLWVAVLLLAIAALIGCLPLR